MTKEKEFLNALFEEINIICKPQERVERVQEALEIIHTMVVSRLEELNQENV
jgi:hypothetical protein